MLFRSYHDHLRQPGNTKKRKVPTNMNGSSLRVGRETDELDPGLGGEQQQQQLAGAAAAEGGVGVGDGTGGGAEGGTGGAEADGNRGPPYSIGGLGSTGSSTQFPLGRLPLSALSTFTTTCPTSARVGQLKSIVRVRGKLAGAMVAGIQHKELLKARKRQLAAVMGVLSQGDTLALDQALSMVGNTGPLGGTSSTAPTPGPGRSSKDAKENLQIEGEQKGGSVVRLSRRSSARMARAVVRTMKSGGTRQTGALPNRKFTFACDSTSKCFRPLFASFELLSLFPRWSYDI